MPDAAGATATTPSQGSAATPSTNGASKAVPSSTPKAGTGTGAPTKGATSSTGQPGKGSTSVAKGGEKGQESRSESPAVDDDAWDDTKDKAELERLVKRWSKHDQRARVKVRGEEKGIESIDDLYSVITDAQRGRGAHLKIEETNKRAAEAEKILELRERASKGDLHALRELAGDGALQGLQQLQAQHSEEAKLREQMSDVERMLFDERNRAVQELRQHQEAAEKAKKEKEEHSHRQRVETAKAEAQGMAKSIIEGLKLPPEKLDVAGPFVVRAMREAAELGLQLGKDVSPEALLNRAREEMQGVVSEAIDGLQPDQLADFLGEERLRQLAKVFYDRSRNQAPRPPPPLPPRPKGNGSESDPFEVSLGTPGYLFSRSIFAKK